MIQVAWNGIVFGDPGFSLNTLVGWLELPGAEFSNDGATSGHGGSVSAGVQGERIVVAGGYVEGYGGARDGLIASLRRAMVPRSSQDDTLDNLVVTAAGRTDTAKAQLVRYALSLDPKNWASGSIPWSAQWRCPDPRVFGAEITDSALLFIDTVGAILPFSALPKVLPPKPLGGRVSIFNPGNDPEGSPVEIILTGAQSGSVGVLNATTGVQVTYGFGLGVTDSLRIESERGSYLNGVYRPPTPGSGIISGLRAAPGVVNVYQALGTAGAGSPSISVTLHPASW